MGRAMRVDFAKGRSNAGGRGGGNRPKRMPDWDCQDCGTAGNFGSRPTCFKCGAKNPAWEGEIPQNWECKACGGDNFPSRSSCFKCSEPKPYESPAAESKSVKLNVTKKRAAEEEPAEAEPTKKRKAEEAGIETAAEEPKKKKKKKDKKNKKKRKAE